MTSILYFSHAVTLLALFPYPVPQSIRKIKKKTLINICRRMLLRADCFISSRLYASTKTFESNVPRKQLG